MKKLVITAVTIVATVSVVTAVAVAAPFAPKADTPAVTAAVTQYGNPSPAPVVITPAPVTTAPTTTPATPAPAAANTVAPKPHTAKAAELTLQLVKAKKNKKAKTLKQGDKITIGGITKVLFGTRITVTDGDGTSVTLIAGKNAKVKLINGVLTFTLTTDVVGDPVKKGKPSKAGTVKGLDTETLTITSIRGAYAA